MAESIIIRAVTELVKNSKDIERICLEENLPIYLTKNGSNHLVIMSHERYEQQQAKIALYEGVITAEGQYLRGEGMPMGEAKILSDTVHKERIRK